MAARRVVAFAMLLLLGLMTPRSQAQETATPVPEAELTPNQYQQMLCARRCFHEPVTVNLPALKVSTVNQLDLVILIDNSASMGDVIKAAQHGSQEIVDGVRGLLSDTRFAIAAFSDYVDVPWRLYTRFTTSLDAVRGGINTIELLEGGDTPESYGRALWEVSRLDWRPNAAKVVVIFTDAPAKDPDPGLDGQYNTADDLHYASVLDALAKRDIRVIGINSAGSFYENGDLRQAADVTHGLYFDMEDVNTIPQTLINLLRGLLDSYRLRFTPQDAAQADWFSQSPTAFDYPVDGAPVTVNLDFCPYEQQLSTGNYSVRLDLSSRNNTYGTLPVNIDYYAQCVALTIPDTTSDDGTQCSSGDYWESPSIAIRQASDGLYTSENPVVGVPNYVYVQIVNRGPLATTDAVLTLYASPSLLVGDFPADWVRIGNEPITLQVNDSQWFGPFQWTPQTNVVALRAEVHDPEDQTSQPNNARCESNLAQINRTNLTLDNYSIIPNYIAAAMPLNAHLPDDQTGLDLTIDGSGLTGDGIAGLRSGADQAEVRQPFNGGALLIRDFLSRAAPVVVNGRLVIGASSPVTNGVVYLTLGNDNEVEAGATIRVVSAAPLANAPADDVKKPTTEIPAGVLAGVIGIFGLILVITLVFALRSRPADDGLNRP